MAREVGYGLIRATERRLADILRKPTWAASATPSSAKQNKSTSIRRLQDERSQRMKNLGDVPRTWSAKARRSSSDAPSPLAWLTALRG